eukprot:96224-Amphidinium_carterae.1
MISVATSSEDLDDDSSRRNVYGGTAASDVPLPINCAMTSGANDETVASSPGTLSGEGFVLPYLAKTVSQEGPAFAVELGAVAARSDGVLGSSSCLVASSTLNADVHVLLSSPSDEVSELAAFLTACLEECPSQQE